MSKDVEQPVKTAEDEQWDSGELGQSDEHVEVASRDEETSVDETLGLQMISIRLQKGLIEQLKFIAEYHGIGYQPLIRDVLCRWARQEMLVIADQMKQELEAKAVLEAAKLRA